MYMKSIFEVSKTVSLAHELRREMHIVGFSKHAPREHT